MNNVSSQVIRVLLVEDHPAIREGLSHRIQSQEDMEMCGEANNVREALQLVTQEQPDVVIVDIALKDSDGLELARVLQSRRASTKVIFHSMYDEATYAERCLNVGAVGYVNKQASPEEVISAIRDVMAGNIYVSREMSNRIISRKGSGKDVDPLDSLTDRQLEIFRLIGEGKGASEIAKQLHLSVHTIESHRENIKRKLGVTGSPELIRAAVLWANRRAEEESDAT